MKGMPSRQILGGEKCSRFSARGPIGIAAQGTNRIRAGETLQEENSQTTQAKNQLRTAQHNTQEISFS